MADEDEAAAEEEATDESGNEGGGGGKKKLIIIGGIVLVLLLGGGGAAFFLMSGGDEKKDEVATAAGSNEESEEEVVDEKTADSAAEGDAKKDGQTAEAKKDDDDEESLLEGVDFGETYSFKTFNLNLGNPLENRFVRMDVSVEFNGGEKQKAELERRLPQLRDTIVSVSSRKSREFLLGPDGKDQLRRELLIRLNRYMSKPLTQVYITDILIE